MIAMKINLSVIIDTILFQMLILLQNTCVKQIYCYSKTMLQQREIVLSDKSRNETFCFFRFLLTLKITDLRELKSP